MNDLPRTARAYLIAVWLIAAIAIAATLVSVRSALLDQAPLLALVLLLFIIADYFEVETEIDNGNRVSMTVVDAPTIFLLAVAGPAGIVVVVLGTAIVDVLGKRSWYKVLFNLSQRSLAYLTMLLIYSSLHAAGSAPFGGLSGLATFVLIAVTYHTLNVLFVATILALAMRQPLLKVYRDSLREVRWVHFITLPFGAVLAALWYIDAWLLLPGIIPLIMAQRSFKAMAAWRSESRRNEELARESRQLAAKLERLQDTTTAMIASLEPITLLETVSSRLAALLEATASWVVLLSPPRLVAVAGAEPALTWDVAAYQAELRSPSVRQLDAAQVARLHQGSAVPGQALVIIPLALEQRVLGGICLASEQPIVLAEDDRRVLLAFGTQAALAMERVQLFEELRLKQGELVRSSKLAALGTFSAGIAHEFNNLLAGILGHAELGLMSQDVGEKDEALNVAVRTSLRGKSITRGLLTFARRNDAQRALYQIQDAVDETLALVERELAKVNVRVERRLRSVPPTICDLGQISQVVLNLITNARDAMIEQGGGVITIDLSQRGDQLELAVSDTGVGIPEQMLQQIFQPFVTTKGALGGSSVPGTGLGLAISYGIVESHGGTIIPHSEVGRGTTMLVRLPIVSPAADAEQLASRAGAPQLLQVLIVDDEQTVANALARLLEGVGHSVRVAPDGIAGLRLYREQRFDLVISDVVMPGMGGAEFVRRLRALDPRAQVLVVTGQASAQTDEMLRGGAFGVIGKPFVIDEVLAAMRRGQYQRMLAAA
ncbi:MAG: response regulator [Kouleothrix sp.]|nr:response regulator [Kouleothrix sp.]